MWGSRSLSWVAIVSGYSTSLLNLKWESGQCLLTIVLLVHDPGSMIKPVSIWFPLCCRNLSSQTWPLTYRAFNTGTNDSFGVKAILWLEIFWPLYRGMVNAVLLSTEATLLSCWTYASSFIFFHGRTSLAYTTRTTCKQTSKGYMTWIIYIGIVVWHMRVSACLLKSKGLRQMVDIWFYLCDQHKYY